MRTYSRELANAVISVFKANNYNYQFDAENGLLTSNWTLSGKIKTAKLHFLIDDSICVARANIDIHADNRCRDAVADLLTRLNYSRINFGAYQMDYSDGEIRFEYIINCSGFIPSEAIIKNATVFLIHAFDGKTGNAILSVMYGLMTPEEAMNCLE